MDCQKDLWRDDYLYSCFSSFGLSFDQSFALCLVYKTQFCIIEGGRNSQQLTALVFYADLLFSVHYSLSGHFGTVDKFEIGESDDDCFGVGAKIEW